MIKFFSYSVLLLLFLLTFIWFKPLPTFEHDNPRILPWQLPDYSAAKTSVEVLADGRLKLTIEHLPLLNIEPKMIAWFYQHLPISTVEISGVTLPLYHIFHPSEHGKIWIEEIATDGSQGMAVGALVARQEWFGRFNSKGAGRVIEFSAQGMLLQPEMFGLPLGVIRHSFEQAKFVNADNIKQVGTQYQVVSIIGSDLPILGPLINYYIRHKVFHPNMIKQWLRHQVEEVASLQFFLNTLYHTQPVEHHYQLDVDKLDINQPLLINLNTLK